jgi:arylsulfatase A-like enzyme
MIRSYLTAFFGKISTILLSIVFCLSSAWAQQGKKPNFILILADDMGWVDLGADGSRIETSNLDKMAREGMKFTHFYAQAALCSPTRAALLSGRYQHTVGVPELCNPDIRSRLPKLHLDLDAIVIPEALKPQGYQSMLAGKWHLGYEPEYWPRQHGFDKFWGSLIGTPNYWNPLATYDNETPIKVDGYYTDKITENAIEFIRDNKNNPFFLFLSYNAPHYPLEAPEELIRKYEEVFDYDKFAIYAAMVESMDTGIGEVFEALRELSLDDNTFVFFTADNGPSAEARDGKGYGLKGSKISAGPLREHKFSTHEGGIRVPAIAWWPGQIPAGSITGAVASTMDIYPTYMDILKADPGTELHGISILQTLQGKRQKIRRALHWEDAVMWAVQEGKWKLVGRFWEPQPALYDLSRDIGEQHDLSAKHPKVFRRMIGMHKEWQAKYYPNPYPRHTERQPPYQFPQE